MTILIFYSEMNEYLILVRIPFPQLHTFTTPTYYKWLPKSEVVD